MEIQDYVVGILLIILGILVMVFPDLLKWIVGVTFIAVGILALINKRGTNT